MNEKLQQIVADVLQMELRDVTPTTSRKNTAIWDSMKHIEIVTAVEAEFDVTFTVQQIEAIVTYYDLLSALERFRCA